MSRVRIVATSMVALRAAAIEQVNKRYNDMAAQNIQRDAAHAYKRSVAADVLAGAVAPVEFDAEAAMRDMNAMDLARMISSKPNEAAQRELERQRELLAIAAAERPDQLPQV